jgi:hypothetical protein
VPQLGHHQPAAASIADDDAAGHRSIDLLVKAVSCCHAAQARESRFGWQGKRPGRRVMDCNCAAKVEAPQDYVAASGRRDKWGGGR